MKVGQRARRLWGLCCLGVAVAGCGDDVSATSEGSSSGSSTGTTSASSTSGAQTSADASTAGADESSSDEGFEPPDPACGNGFVEGDEECDDANDLDDDGCTSACQLQCGLEWTLAVLPPTDQSLFDARGVATDARGGAAIVGFLREITTDQRGIETAELDAGLVTVVDAQGQSVWTEELSVQDAQLDVTGVAIDGAGSVYVSATVRPPAGDQDIRVYKLGSDGSALWTFTHDSAIDSAEDISFGIAMGADGNPVVAGQVRVAEGDDDVWVASVDASEGEALWSSTWSGEFSGSFSTDDGGPIAVGPDGTIYVLAGEYVDFQTRLVTLLAFGADGGPVTSTHTPQAEPGQMQFAPLDVSVNEEGAVLLTFERASPTGPESFVTRWDPQSDAEQWRVDAVVFEDATSLSDASDFTIAGADPLPGGGVAILGSLVRSGDGTSWRETWVARLNDADALDCLYVRESPQLSLVPGSLAGRAMSTGPGGRAVVAAQLVDEGTESLWIGAFRPD